MRRVLILCLAACSVRADDWESKLREASSLERDSKFAEAERVRRRLEVESRAFVKSDERRGYALAYLGGNLHLGGKYTEAEQWMRKAVGTLEQGGLRQSKAWAFAAANLGATCRMNGKYAESEKFQLLAIEVLESIHGPAPAAAAPILRNLVELYKFENRLADARRLGAKALAATDKERAGQPDAVGLRHRGLALAAMGRHEDAIQAFRDALSHSPSSDAFQRALLNDLGHALFAVSDYKGAEEVLRRAVALWRDAVHSSRAATVNNLAQAIRLQGRFEEAEPLYRESISLWEKSVGVSHQDYARGLGNLAEFFRVQGKLNGAAALYRQAIEIGERNVPKTHPQLAFLRCGLAAVYAGQGRSTEALRLLREALPIAERASGPSDPRVAEAVETMKRVKNS